MKPIHIFKAGNHTSAGGKTLAFSEDILSAAASAYDPKIHEAPIVIGHPADNHPAFGWVGNVSYGEDGLHADPSQVNADFEEMVQSGAFKKVSASFYSPDSPTNPVPGSYYLRHVGFLGAQPPAIKGLQGISFAEGGDDIVEFSGEWETSGIFRRLREFIIDKFSKEEADEVIPAYMVESLEDAARNPEPTKDSLIPAYSEPNEDDPMPMTAAQIAKQDELNALEIKLKADAASFSERENTLAATEIAQKTIGIKAQVEALVAAGKILPVHAIGMANFAANLVADQVVEFAEGDEGKKDASAWLFDFLETLPKQVDFEEQSNDDGEGPSSEGKPARTLANEALEYRETELKAGRDISITQAVNYVAKKAAV